MFIRFGSLTAAILAFGLSFCEAANAASDVTRAKLDNGLRIVVVHSSLAPVVTTVMNYLVGSNEAPAGYPGMAHALEHMMFRGSPGLSADQLANIAANMGGDFNADTQQSVTQFFFTMPKQDLEVALHIEAIRMQGLLATDALWEHERGAIEQEVARDLSNPEYVFYTDLLTAMFKGTPYAHDALGTRPSFNMTTGAMLQNFHQTWYAPNNAILVIAGDVDPAAAIAQVKALFGPIPSKTLPAKAQVQLGPVKAETLHLTTDLPYGLAVEAFRWPGSRSPEFAAAQVLSDVLSSQRGSLYDLVPQGKALSAGFAFNDLPRASLGYALAAFPAGGNGTMVLDEVRGVLENIAKNGVPADLVTAAKRHEVASAEFQKNSISGLAMLWSRVLALEDRQSPSEDIDAIQKVTPADVTRLAASLLNQNDAIAAILVPQPSGKPISSSSFGGSESFAASPSTSILLPAWAQKVNQLSIPTSTVHPSVMTLSNGLKLIVQPENISDTISVYGYIRNNSDLESPKDQEGVSDMLDQLLSYGTVSLDRVAFQKALDDIGANESAGTDFSLEVLANHFDRGVELLAQNELHPALPAGAFKIIQGQLAETVAGELKSPGYLTQHALESALLPNNDPDLRHATPASVSSLSLADVHSYHSRVYRPDLTTIVVIGKVTPEQARAAIEHNFGTWKAEGPKPQTLLPAVPRNEPSNTAVPNTSRVQDEVTLAEALPMNRANPDYYALNLGNRVLGGSFYASRLSRDLRENAGLVYTVSSRIESGPTRTFYAVSYGCDPPNVSKARAIIERDLKQMQDEPVPEDPLHLSKVLLLQQIPLSEASVDSIADGLISRVRNQLPLDEPTLAAHKYVDLTAGQVKAAFAKWIRVNDLVQVTQGPAPK
ncbi:MAG TPA: pitrilysin family protein [Bryobacteraceae bacterium]|nr:pitrilysin family protein [Bryobacteraceae bacterium]